MATGPQGAILPLTTPELCSSVHRACTAHHASVSQKLPEDRADEGHAAFGFPKSTQNTTCLQQAQHKHLQNGGEAAVPSTQSNVVILGVCATLRHLSQLITQM